MTAPTIGYRSLLGAILAVSAVETLGRLLVGSDWITPLSLLTVLRTIQILVLWATLRPPLPRFRSITAGGWRAVIKRSRPAISISSGLLIAGWGISVFDIDLPLPETVLPTGFTKDWLILTCLLSPLAEELFFRGLLFSYFRPWGVLPAAAISSLVFAGFHATGMGIPLLPLAGGILFAASYEIEKNLLSPFLLHATGNALLFFVL